MPAIPLRVLLLSAIVLLALLAAFLGYKTLEGTNQLAALEAASEAEKAELTASIEELTQALTEAQEARTALSAELQAEQARTNEFERTLKGLRKTVGTLEKLQYTDPELLAKYSKVYFLNENYAPEDLARIPNEYTFPANRELSLHARVLPYMTAMFKAAEKDGISLRALSAYRSFGTQEVLKASYKVSYGTGANRFSADQGYSEHQLGTTIDVTTPELGNGYTSIDTMEAYAWLTKNAHRYGFVLSYPKGNAYYQYEPWHWRFVGEKLASDLKEQSKYLYDLDQRTLDEYLEFLFD